VEKTVTDKMTYIQGDLTKPELYAKIRAALDEAEKTRGTAGNAIFYLAVADRFFGTVVEQLGKAKLTDQGEGKDQKRKFWRRVVIEKPFGHSLDSARELNARILRTLREDQIFGSTTSSARTRSRTSWRSASPTGCSSRSGTATGSITCRSPWRRRSAWSSAANSTRRPARCATWSRTTCSRCFRWWRWSRPSASMPPRSAPRRPTCSPPCPRSSRRAVRGQYGAGTVLGKPVKAYRQEPDVAPDSNIETYVAMQFEIDNWRWAGVPFYVRTGKHMSQRNTEIAIRFKQAPYAAFQDTPSTRLRPNWLVLRIQPDEGISLQFEVKRRGRWWTSPP
jgi:glucose-6-phosphate 1-dehydrogenase